jgi:hypothetical protein
VHVPAADPSPKRRVMEVAPMLSRKFGSFGLALTAALLVLTAPLAQGIIQSRSAAPAAITRTITTPKAALGFNIGDDYQLANYTQLSSYLKKLAAESSRIKLVEYGKTSEGRPMLMAIITSPANHARLDHFKNIARRLALAEGLTDEAARALAAEGKAVVWVDAGLHATEIANSQALAEMAYQMASRNDAETRRILDDVIFLLAFSNPDGLELVTNWYMREKDPVRRTMSNLPVLYQKYIGHDNNRESLLCNMPESTSIARVLYTEWFPQIMYNQHQSGPAGAVLFIGTMRDPTNPNLDPLLAPSTELVSAAIHSRYVAEGKPGATNRSFASYQNWWNGGIRSTVCFHNQIGILSEISGGPTPTEITFVPKNLVMGNDNPYPIPPQPWHFRQTIDYLITAERATLDIASEHRENFLFNIYRMGKNSIDKGNRDNWTMSAHRVAAVQQLAAKEGVQTSGRGGALPAQYYERLKDPAARDPRGYILPSDQPDFLTATKFVNSLVKNGVTVHRATAALKVAGKSYPAGSYVVKTAQAFRPHVVDCFEPQDYPDDFAYPGGPPVRPYDVTGYTLALQMGVQFDRILDGFDGPFEKITGFAQVPAGRVNGNGAGGFLLSHETNDAFVAINQLLASGEDVYWLKDPVQTGGKTFPAGTIYIGNKGTTASKLQKLAAEKGLTFEGVAARPTMEALQLQPLHIGIVDVYGGSMPSGWVQWLFSQYGFPFEVVFPPALDAGGLTRKFDVLVFENGLIPPPGRGEPRPIDPQSVPAEYRARLGGITEAKTLPRLKQFLADGGSIVAIGSSTNIAQALGIGVANALVDDKGRPLSGEQFYVPGSILQVRIDRSHPLAYGLPERLDIFYDNNPLFRIEAASAATSSPAARRVAWFDSDQPLRSGWAWGQKYLNGAVAAAEARVGKGTLVLLGPLVAFRAHPHGTFKFLFNGVYYGSAKPVTLGAAR